MGNSDHGTTYTYAASRVLPPHPFHFSRVLRCAPPSSSCNENLSALSSSGSEWCRGLRVSTCTRARATLIVVCPGPSCGWWGEKGTMRNSEYGTAHTYAASRVLPPHPFRFLRVLRFRVPPFSSYDENLSALSSSGSVVCRGLTVLTCRGAREKLISNSETRHARLPRTLFRFSRGLRL